MAPELTLKVECLAALVTLGRPQPLVSLVNVLTQVCELLLACGTLVLKFKKYLRMFKLQGGAGLLHTDRQPQQMIDLNASLFQ